MVVCELVIVADVDCPLAKIWTEKDNSTQSPLGSLGHSHWYVWVDFLSESAGENYVSYRMMLDTGAGLSVVSERWLKELRIHEEETWGFASQQWAGEPKVRRERIVVLKCRLTEKKLADTSPRYIEGFLPCFAVSDEKNLKEGPVLGLMGFLVDERIRLSGQVKQRSVLSRQERLVLQPAFYDLSAGKGRVVGRRMSIFAPAAKVKG